jgi:hypothetical protein
MLAEGSRFGGFGALPFRRATTGPFAPPAEVLKAAEYQDWAALSRLLPLGSAINPAPPPNDPSAVDDAAAAAAAGDAAALLRALGNGASEAGAAGLAAGSSLASSLHLRGGSAAEAAATSGLSAYRDAETGMHALHWVARHGRLSEADFIAPVSFHGPRA